MQGPFLAIFAIPMELGERNANIKFLLKKNSLCGSILQSLFQILKNQLKRISALIAYVWGAAPCSALPTAESSCRMVQEKHTVVESRGRMVQEKEPGLCGVSTVVESSCRLVQRKGGACGVGTIVESSCRMVQEKEPGLCGVSTVVESGCRLVQELSLIHI